MESHVAKHIAFEVERSIQILIGLTEFVRQNATNDEQFVVLQSIGEFMAIQTDKIVPFLLSKRPELQDEIAPWLNDDGPPQM
jgi:hypothetical protein